MDLPAQEVKHSKDLVRRMPQPRHAQDCTDEDRWEMVDDMQSQIEDAGLHRVEGRKDLD